MLQHIFNKNAISAGGVLDENVSNGADQLSILNDGASAHSLDDAASQLQQPGICHFDDQTFIFVGGRVIHFLNLDFIVFRLSGNTASDIGGSFLYVLALADGDRLTPWTCAEHSFDFFPHLISGCAENALFCVGVNGSEL